MRRRRKYGVGALAAVLLLLTLTGIGRWSLVRWLGDLPPYSASFSERRVERLEMRDGARLTTQIYLPEGDGPWPTVLARSPYNIHRSFETICKVFTFYGYACVHQDVRGRLGSEGVWYPLLNERADGLDTLAWLTAQPWQNGQIALFGPSYLGAVQWLLADALPPEVKTIIPMVIGTDVYAMAYQNGVFRHDIVTAWAALMPDNEMRYENGDAYWSAIEHRPMIEIDERFFGNHLEWYRGMMTSPGRGDAFWQQPEILQLRTMPERTEVPVLMIASWYGFFSPSQIDIFARLQSRAQSKLIIGPWSHIHRDFGELELPEDRSIGWQLETILDWLDHHLRGQRLKQQRGVVETYAFEEGRWRVRNAWPPPTEPRRFYLGDLGGAGWCDSGSLSSSPPPAAERVSFTYDPKDPVPTRGGSGLLAFAIPGFGGLDPGSFDQEGMCDRPDVLSFVSDPLDSALHLAGSVKVHLTVSSTAPDTTFSAKLLRVNAEGEAFNITDSITSLSFRDGADTAQAYEPGTTVTFELALPPIEWRLPAGSRLRLDLSSSNFPAYHPHPNVAGAWAMAPESQIATQTVMAGGEAEAWVDIPAVAAE